VLYRHKVLITIPVLLVGGTEKQTLTLASVLLSGGYKVTVCCYYEADASMVSEMEKTGSEVILLGLKRADGLLSLLSKLRILFKKMEPDIVHVQYIAPGLIPVIAAKLAGIKTVFATVHQPGRVYGWKEKLLLRTAARLCTAFFCNSKAVEESWFGDSEIFDPNKKYKNRRHFTIYNAVDVDHIEQIIKKVDRGKFKKELGIDNKSVIGVVGRLRWEKGQDILLNAMPEVVKKIPNTVLLVVGDGPDRKSLEQRAKSLGLENNILWLGQRSAEEVYELYKVMDVVVVPSRFEGFGLTAAESIAAGCPVIASAVDGLAEVIQDGLTGLLFPSGDTKKLASLIIDLFADKKKALNIAGKGKNDIRNRGSLEKYDVLIISAYQKYKLK